MHQLPQYIESTSCPEAKLPQCNVAAQTVGIVTNHGVENRSKESSAAVASVQWELQRNAEEGGGGEGGRGGD